MKLLALLILLILPTLIKTRSVKTTNEEQALSLEEMWRHRLETTTTTTTTTPTTIPSGKTFKSVEGIKDHFGKQHHIDSTAIKDSAGKFFT